MYRTRLVEIILPQYCDVCLCEIAIYFEYIPGCNPCVDVAAGVSTFDIQHI